MSLLETITSDLLQAAKNNEPLVRDTLRGLKSSIKNSEIAKGHTLSDDEIVDVLTKEVKQRKESIDSFTNGGRPELAEKEQAEIDILNRYLPEQMSEDEVRSIVDEVLTTTGASTKQEMGKVMGALMPRLKGKADMSLVSRLVNEKLH